MSVLTCSGLTSGYAGVAVVRDVTLSIEEGELVAVLGANGAGKTTLLSTMAGLIAPMRGDVTLLGEPVPAARPHRCVHMGLSFVPDDRALFTNLTVRENLQLAAGRDWSRAERILTYFPVLTERSRIQARMLSGGEQQMLALARALITSPKVLLIDELSLGLAPRLAATLLQVVRRLADEQGTAVVVVEQHVGMALDVAHRGVVLAKGEVVREGTAAELRSDRFGLAVSYLGRADREAHDREGGTR